MVAEAGEPDPDLAAFLVRLGAAMSTSGRPVDVVQRRLSEIARAFGTEGVRVGAFPTFLVVAVGPGGPATLELTSPLAASPRLDQIAAVDQLADDAARGRVEPRSGLARLERIEAMPRRFSRPISMLGYGLFAVGVCLVLRPMPREIAAAAILGLLVGAFRVAFEGSRPLRVLTPVIAAFSVAALTAFAVRHGLNGIGLRAIVASLVVFLPGASLTTAVLELGSGQTVSGASRLVSGIVDLMILAFGIVAGIQAAGIPATVVLNSRVAPLGAWAPWLGLPVFVLGVIATSSAPRGALPGLLVVLVAAWSGQVLGNLVLGGYFAVLFGAAVLTVSASLLARHNRSMPAHAYFLPGFWLLVPGSIGLIGLTRWVGVKGAVRTGDLLATVASIFGVALGVLCGTLVWSSALATRHAVADIKKPEWFQRRPPQLDGP
jgi:uncharacterized membrane protein YjjP (DUF1212 family)